MPADAHAQAHIRIARPTRDLDAAERFWTRGLGLSVIWRREITAEDPPGEDYRLVMVGRPDAGWHLELAYEASAPAVPTPTEEDLLVVYLDGPVPDELVARLEAHGGKRVAAHNPYWDTWGVTVEDPDGYRLVLCTRGWTNTVPDIP
ncbi:VOC family protein [Streptomyces sp. UNOC14_S4]|uniref:VOC family protein n=1 Tax=Streptomyces sp. UNOC14_S4 TaxID=2872340 RepID=UPI001E47BBBC|nr:VOC family protein [Streptomyces sp. UNOC14_S4]MCC3768590.1 VOC family protein [Streptomyces sp. UNOC14_S4]